MNQQWVAEPMPYPNDAHSAPSSSRWATVTIIVAGVIAVVALVVCGYLGWKVVGDQRAISAGREARSAASTQYAEFLRNGEAHTAGAEAQKAAIEFAGLLINVDYKDPDRNTSKVLANSTGEFKAKYSSSSAQLRQVLVENRAVATGIVVDSAIQSETANKVTLLLFVDQSVTNTAVPDARMDRSRPTVTMEKADGRWLTSNFELL
ncbi:DUF3329 domain-containing protein [Mycobacteroides sp. LB1]|uniref:DUF3329 domain-containing protein n=1 Tax=Mycobacteroides sp. LB1 TaxID=2750814 RepID=UPI0015E0208F|nr:DUF3329 domain-containing protein [Mycobacteroides sp. LB1]